MHTQNIGLKRTFKTLETLDRVPNSILFSAVITVCCKEYNVEIRKFHFKDEKQKNHGKPQGASNAVSSARHLFCYIVKLYLKPHMTHKKIGMAIYDGFDHSAVSYALKRVKEKLDIRDIVQEDIDSQLDLIDTEIRRLCLLESQVTQEAARILQVNSSGTLSPNNTIKETRVSNLIRKRSTRSLGG